MFIILGKNLHYKTYAIPMAVTIHIFIIPFIAITGATQSQRGKARREVALSALALRETIYLLDSSTRRDSIPPDDLFAPHFVAIRAPCEDDYFFNH
ncbi:unnamed protein product [Leptosia nina]|uniref:Uncharacterized protein n=1 Tax=Leptosia nina TaxID=320188 RepID=A0AAV1JL08_9NEOP